MYVCVYFYVYTCIFFDTEKSKRYSMSFLYYQYYVDVTCGATNLHPNSPNTQVMSC